MAEWMTIPEWSSVKQINVFHREQDARPLPLTGAPENLHVLVWGELELPEGESELRISADDRYQLWIDGRYAGQGPCQAYPEEYTYDSYHLTKKGRAAIAVHLYYQGLVNRAWNSGDGRFGLWLSLLQKENETDRCDERWRYYICRAYSGSPVGYDTQFLENFDSRLWPEGWELDTFDHRGWGFLVSAPWADYGLRPRKIRPLWEGELKPESVREITGGFLLDFGRELAGRLVLRAVGRDGERITLRCGEELESSGRVRFKTRCGCDYEERWTLADGENLLHQYDYRGFRYAEVLFPEGTSITECGALEQHYPMREEICTLSCPADQLEDIFRICKNAVRCCTQEGYLDCVTREKAQYLGDALITARSQVWLTGNTDMLRKCAEDFIASAMISPTLMSVAPCSQMQEIADYSLLFPVLVMIDHEFTGDMDFLSRCYPAVRDMTASFSAYQRPDGLICSVRELWNMVDWPESLRDVYDFPLTRPAVGEGCHNVINALWYGANRIQERMEELLGLTSAGRSEQIGRAFRKAFYRREKKLFADSDESSHCSLYANLYAAYFGLLPSEAEDAYEELLLNGTRTCGIFPMYFALKGLGRLGRPESLYRLLTREDANGWRNMLRQGASACFETWGREQKWNTSLCHSWASGAISLLIEEIGGIVPCPEMKRGYRFSPHIPERAGNFTLTVPWRNGCLRVTKKAGCPAKLERMDENAVSKDE